MDPAARLVLAVKQFQAFRRPPACFLTLRSVKDKPQTFVPSFVNNFGMCIEAAVNAYYC
jgi:hypothetical protein